MEEKKPPKKIWIPKVFIVLLVFVTAVIGLYLYNKNLFPVWNVTLKPGMYRYAGEGGGEIIASDNFQLRFQNFDLNEKVKGTYYPQDLNAIFLDKDRQFVLIKGMTGIYNLAYRMSGDREALYLEYYPREDKLVVLTANESKSFTFELAEE